MADTRPTPWLEEWDRGQHAYFGDRHKAAHFAALARSLEPHLPAGGVLLDYGPGDALHVPAVAHACRQVVLCEAAPRIRAGLGDRFGDHPDVRVIGPADLPDLAPGSVDVVLVQSVLQYLTAAELDALLTEAARLLPPGGVLMLGDLVAPGAGPGADLAELVRFAARGRFLRSALARLAALPASTYARTRRRHGLATHTVDALTATVAAHGFDAHPLGRNLGNNAARWTLHARRR